MPGMHQIRASAGAGKTYTLTQEFLKLLVKCSMSGAQSKACAVNYGEDPGDWRGILAITFTNAAATEMQDRVIRVLKQIALGEKFPGITLPGRDGKERPVTVKEAEFWVDHILQDRDSLSISTIDSLLNLILRMCALPEGLPPDFAPVFDLKDILTPCLDRLMDQAWQGDEKLNALIRNAWKQLIAEDQQKGFLARGTIEAKLGNLLPLIFRGELADPRVPAEDGGPLALTAGSGFAAPLAEYKQAIYQNAGKICAMNEKPYKLNKRYSDGLKKAVDAFNDEWHAGGGKGDPQTLEDFEKIRIRGTDKRLGSSYLTYTQAQVNGRKKLEGNPELEKYDVMQEALAKNAGDFALVEPLAVSTRVYGCFLELAWRVWDLYKEMEAQGSVYNDSIPGRVRDILETGGASEAVCRLGTRLQHFLIDEFQDTNDQQWEALKPLVSEALSRGGTLTWVGDVKQAIYGFRGGNSELFGQVAEDGALTGSADGVVLQPLKKNYRSYKEIIDFNNAVFSALGSEEKALAVLLARFGETDQERIVKFTCGEVPGLCGDGTGPDSSETLAGYFADKVARTYKDAVQDPTPMTKEGGAVHIVRYPDRPPQKDIADGVPDPVAAGVIQALRREEAAGVRWQDMLILVRANRTAQSMARLLAAENIPAVTENSLLVRSHPLIVQTEALLSFLLNPQDDAAFWTLATGCIFSHCLADAEGVSRRDLDDEMVSLMADADRRRRGQDDALPAVPLSELWRRAHPDVWEQHIAPLFRGLSAMTVYDIVCEWYRHENVYARFSEAKPFLQRFLEIISSCAGQGITSLPDFLTQWQEHGGEEKVPMPEGMDAVSIMTIHKAKGLQAPVVIYPLLEAKSHPSKDLGVIEYTDHEGTTFRGLGRPGTMYPQGAEKALALDAFETLNTFYVAFTRAEKNLWLLYADTNCALGPMMDALLDSCAGAEGVPDIETEIKDGKNAKSAPDTDAGNTSDTGDGGPSDGNAGTTSPGGEQQLTGCADDTPRWGGKAEPAAEEGNTDGGEEIPGQDIPDLTDGDIVYDEDGFAMIDMDGDVPPEEAWPPEDGQDGVELPPFTAYAESDSVYAFQSDMSEQAPGIEPWVPMSWVPKLHVHLDYMDESHPLNPAREQGIFIHACLEELARLPRPARNVDPVLDRNFRRKPWLREVPYHPGGGAAPSSFPDQARTEITWFLSIPGAQGWMDNGLAEQSLLRGGRNARMLRVDLLVPSPDGALVIDYKHGSKETLSPEVEQGYEDKMRLYLKSLAETGLKNPLAVLCYLTRRECCVVNAAGRTIKTDAQGLAAAIAAMRENNHA